MAGALSARRPFRSFFISGGEGQGPVVLGRGEFADLAGPQVAEPFPDYPNLPLSPADDS